MSERKTASFFFRKEEIMTVISGVCHIGSGVEVTESVDERGDVWKKVSQLPFFIEGEMTPLGRLADLFMRQES